MAGDADLREGFGTIATPWLILANLTVAGGGLAVFLWSLRSGQYEDLEGAANRILYDD